MADKNIKLIDTNTLLFYHQQLKLLLGDKVDKVIGKSLVSDDEILRLASVDNYDDSVVQGAISEIKGQIEVLEKGTYDDSQLRADIEATYAKIGDLTNKATTGYVDTALSTAKEYTDTEVEKIKSTLTGGMHYKGSVNAYSDLPEDANVGDCYNIITASDHNKAGDNAIYTANGDWDITSGFIDLTKYLNFDDIASNEDITIILNS